MSLLPEIRRLVDSLLAGDLKARARLHGTDEEADEILRILNRLADRIQYTADFHEQSARLLSQKTTTLEKMVADLDRANAEFEAFTHAVAHDLRSPLMTIDMVVAIIESRRGDSLDEWMSRNLVRISTSTSTMIQLTDALLAYASVGRESAVLRPVALEEVGERAVNNLRAAIEEHGARVELGPLPQVLGDENGLLQLLQNLIENSLKYRGEEAPVVEVNAFCEDPGWRIVVKDNGLGIDPCHHREIFEAFTRLPTPKPCRGTGIGLATCKKVVTHHGGRIWVESTPGAGSRFCFTLRRSSEEAA